MLNFTRLTYFDDLTLSGNWWIAGSRRHKGNGTLTINPQKGCRLEIHGSLRKRKEQSPSLFVPTDYLTICGTADDGTPITLFKSFVTEQTSTRTIYFVNRVLVGAHFRDLTAVKLNWFAVSLVGMESWVGQRAIHPGIKEDAGSHVWTVTYREPPAISATVPSAKLSLEVGSDGHFDTHRNPPHATLHHRNVITVRPAKPLNWMAYRQRLGEVLDLITLLSAEPLPIRQIRAGVIGRPNNVVAETGAKETAVHIYANLQQPEEEGEAKERDPLFYLMGIKDDFEAICRRWFDVADRLHRVRAAFFSTFRTRRLFLDQRLFAYAQTLEAFHRITATSGKNIDYFKRLRRLFDSLEPDTARMITSDVEKFCRATVDTRNLLAHLDQHQNATPFPREMWHVACKRLETLVFVLLLKQCGIPEVCIRARMGRIPHFRGTGYDFNAPIPDGNW